MFGLSKGANRFLLGSIAAFVIGAVLVVLFVVRFFSMVKENQVAGSEFGKQHDAKACVDESIKRHTVTIDPTREVTETTFIQACLIIANSNDEFCREVPKLGIIVNQVAVAEWADSKCAERGLSGEGCRQAYVGVAMHCKMRDDRESLRKSNR